MFGERVGEVGHVVGQLGIKVEIFASDRVLEIETCGMEAKPGRFDLIAAGFLALHGVAVHWTTEGGQVQPDLMGSAGFRNTSDQRSST